MYAIPREIADNRTETQRGAEAASRPMGDVFFAQDSRGTIKKVSGASWQLFGAGPHRLRGLKLTDLTAARSHPALLGAMMQAIRDAEATVIVDLRPTASAPHAAVQLKAEQGGEGSRSFAKGELRRFSEGFSGIAALHGLHFSLSNMSRWR